MVRCVEGFIEDGKVGLQPKGQNLKLWTRRYDAHVYMFKEPKHGTGAENLGNITLHDGDFELTV